MENHIRMGDALAKISLESCIMIRINTKTSTNYLERVDPKVEKRIQLGSVPVLRVHIGDIEYTEARLPQVPSVHCKNQNQSNKLGTFRYRKNILPRCTVFPLDQITTFHGLIEHRRQLRDVRIDYTQVKSATNKT
jgi:hypothetical protein